MIARAEGNAISKKKEYKARGKEAIENT